MVLSSEAVREKHGRVSSRGDSLKLSVLRFRGNSEGWELSRRKKRRRPWRRAMVSSVSQKTSPGKVVKWNLPVSSPTMFSFEDFFLRAIFSPTARDISFFFSTIASDVLGIFYFTEVMVVSLYITKSGLQYVLCWTLFDNTWY